MIEIVCDKYWQNYRKRYKPNWNSIAFKIGWIGSFFFELQHYQNGFLGHQHLPISKSLKKLFSFRTGVAMETSDAVADSEVVLLDAFCFLPSWQRRITVATSLMPYLFPLCELKSIIRQRTLNITSKYPNRTICTKLNAITEKPSNWALIRMIWPGNIGMSSVWKDTDYCIITAILLNFNTGSMSRLSNF